MAAICGVILLTQNVYAGETSHITQAGKDVTGKDLLNSEIIGPDFFFSDGKKVPVTIALDQLGIVARDGIKSSQIEKFASQFKLKLIHEYPEGIFIFGLSGNFTRPEIVKLARTIQNDGAKLVAYAGFTATPIGAETPFIVSDEFIAQFNPDITREQIDSLNKENGVEIVMQDRFAKNQFLLKVTETSPLDALSMANMYQEDFWTIFSHPNFVRIIDFRQFIPNDPLFGKQWHHQNTGQAGGTVDADVDTPFAWDITRGAAGTIIAVIDGGFDMTHPDLIPNFWVNPGEIPGNGLDDDNNGFIDDINGFDFRDNDPILNPANHGTHVAGIAAARGNNTIGISGACPTCSLMLIRTGNTVFNDSQSFGYAQQMGAQIITNSWGYSIGTPTTTAVVNAINNAATGGRGGLGSVVLFAMNNPNVNDCGANPDISSLANVIAVSRTTNRDQFDSSGFGNCMDVLAPGVDIFSTLIGGYGNMTGTSMATPLVAGTSGLILSVNPGLTRLQVQQLLQDTADKIQDSAGNYAPNTGFSTPATGVATHGWGRINAFESVRVAAPVAQGGKGGVDIFLRNNRLDWGNTEQPSNILFEPTRGYIDAWRSMDIKIDAPPYDPAPTAATFDNFVDETPSAVAGDINRVYVRMRNRGPVMASLVTIKLQWTQFGTALPALPGDFWTVFPVDSSDTTQWHPLKCGGTTSSTCNISNLAYSGSSVANTGADAAQIVTFDFPAPPFDTNLSNHFCLVAMIDSPQDPISPNSRSTFVVDDISPADNNIAHRNYFNLVTSRSRDFVEGFFVRNPTDKQIRAVLRVRAPKGWEISLDNFGFNEIFTLKPNEEVLVTMKVALPGLNQEGEVAVIQEQMDGDKPKVMGGLIFGFVPELGEISGMKFNDLNNNTMKDPGEPGIAGWTINLKESNGNILATSTTDNSGSYTFSELAAGNYVVEELLQADWTQTFPKAPGIYKVTIAPGEKVKGKDFGNFRISLLKGDLNNNGISADAGDLVLMKRASIGEIQPDSRYDLNGNGQNADAGDLVLMKRASIDEIKL